MMKPMKRSASAGARNVNSGARSGREAPARKATLQDKERKAATSLSRAARKNVLASAPSRGVNGAMLRARARSDAAKDVMPAKDLRRKASSQNRPEAKRAGSVASRKQRAQNAKNPAADAVMPIRKKPRAAIGH
jgi:hypothetical protein